MKKEDKNIIVETYTKKISEYESFFITDLSGIDVISTNKLRRNFFKSDIEVKFIKNTLLKKSMINSNIDFEKIFTKLKGHTTIIFSNDHKLTPQIIKDFNKNNFKLTIKGAYISGEIYVGENLIDSLLSLKSKNELIFEIITALNTPIYKVMNSLKSGNSTLINMLENKK